jgi:SAM-dependent methyltransferase
MNRDPVTGDAFGVALLAELEMSPFNRHYIERSDGVLHDILHSVYFAEAADWPAVDRGCIDRVRGRVLDIGAGAGRASLALQQRGVAVTALDVSAGAVEVCRRRGVDDTFHGTLADLVDSGVHRAYDTFLMLGNNVGLLGGVEQSLTVFDQLSRLGAHGARLVGTVGDPYPGRERPEHLEYQERNLALNRMRGQLRLRIRYRGLATSWHDYLFADTAEIAQLAAAAGWELLDFTEGERASHLVEIGQALSQA